MGRKDRKRSGPGTSSGDVPSGHSSTGGAFHNPFAALGGLREELPAGEAPSAPPPAPDSTAPTSKGGGGVPSRVVARRERKGRGGKEVTVVELRGLSAAALPDWLAEGKRALGCGGVVEGDTIVFQGDQRERLRAWLERRGIERLTIG